MKVFAINGSPRKGGNSDILLDSFAKGARGRGAVVSKIYLNELDIKACQACPSLPDNGLCRYRDGMDVVYRGILDSDVIVVASPIYFGSVSAQTKLMVDRFQCCWAALQGDGKTRRVMDKKGVFIAVSAGDRKDFFDNARVVARNFFATIGAEYSAEIFCPNSEEKGDVLKRQGIMAEAERAGAEISGKA
jgi:multimeric flavodoxin WrbA